MWNLWCRSAVVFSFFVLLGFSGLHAEEGSDQASKMQTWFMNSAKSIRMVGGESGNQQFELLKRPALSWSNPERRTATGALFLWTNQGRPQVAMCIYPSTPTTFDQEFQSLSDSPLSASVGGESMWEPLQSGIEFQPLTVGSPPGASAPVRLRNMRNLAREFSAKLVPPQRTEIPLRLLTSPTYRYPPPDAASDIIDGSVFTFVQGTDPEVFLIIEAINDTEQKATWRYALARMTMVPIQVRHKNRLVLETDWAVTRRPNNPYFVLKRVGLDNTPIESSD